MKLLTTSLFILFFVTSTYGNTLLSEDQEQEVLSAIDNICADSWCEGDFDYSFDDVRCDEKSGKCSFDFTLLWYGDVDYSLSMLEAKKKARKYHTTCSLDNIHSLSDILENDNGYYDLTWDFYERFGDECIMEAEEKAYSELNL